GAYEAAVIISSNDPVNPEVEISVLIDVDGLPAILTYPTAYPFEGAQDIEFPNTYVEQENDPVEITIHNLGLGVLEFQNVELTNSDDFSTNAVADISIESHDSTVFEVSFNPAERGFKECTLNFYTNAENIGGGEERGHVWFNLTGTGVVHPVIETDPEDDECIDVTLPPDGIPVEKDLIIRNAAGDYGLDLAFRIRAVNIEEDDRDSDEDFRNLRNSNSNPRRDDPGEILASYNVPFTHTYGMCFDGERIWGVSTSENRLFALNPVNEEIVRSYNLNFSPYSLTFDGEHLWISDHFGNIYLFNLEGNLIETVHTELGYIWGLAYDWNGHVLANAYSRRLIYVISVENYREIASFGIMDRLENIDNRALHCCMEWVPDHIDGSLWILIGEWLTQHFYAMQLSVDDDWAVEEVSRFEFEVPGFIGICHDGKNLWHGGDYRDHTWYVYDEGIFENIVEWLTIEPQAGLIETGDEREIILTFNSEDLEEDQDYFAELQIKSNDPVTREILIDIHLNTSRIEPRELGVFLAQDWNMISINVIPDREFWLRDEGPDIVLMTEQLRIDEDNHHVIILKDSNGEFYMPVYGFNGIPYWNLEQGYMVKVDEDIETTWTGAPIEFDADIHIEQGWNIIPYYPTWELDASADEYYVLSSIIDHVLLAKDVNGDFIAPEYGHSSMQPWRETQGYQINVDEDVTLNYPEAREERSLISKNRSEGGDRIEVTEIRTPNKHWNKPANTGCNMSLLINISNNYQLAEGDQLAAITADGKIAGVGIFNDNRCGLAVWGDDPTTDYIDGLKDGEAYTLKIWDQSRNEALDVEIVNVMKGDGLKYRNDGFTVLSAEITPSAAIPDDYYLSQNYPNPFNETTKLEFGLPQDTRISIAVYDLSGRLVKCLINSDYRAGHYTTIWQADDVVAGIYIVRISATDFTSVKKMILIK
ncbi:T9SS type A sorting domain-containing protein, partial [bacterium]|nr:T9SS type A sorting domain-containing protein [bacterium]